ncbi:MAG: LOG family protein [Dehalococcoidia bacterium]|nr:LOG family protein [Dehalococcoidia bacterium]
MQQSNNIESSLKAVQGILTAGGKDLRSFLYKDIVMNALKCQDLDILDLKIIDRAVAEFQHAACIFKPYRAVRKVSIFGSARVTEDSPYYELAVKFSRSVVEKDFMVITGAADGIMRAGIEGAQPENSFGVNILLPSEEAPAKVIQDDPKLVTFKYFFTRKLFFVMEADAIALLPGGFGTHDEGFEVLTLLQTGKTPPMPVVLMELPGERYWEAWDQFIRQQLLDRGFINSEDLSFYKVMHSSEEAAAWIKSYYSTYHSMRQVRSRLVIRLEKELQDDQIALLNNRFHDLIRSGRIHKTAALAEEADEPDLHSKPRIAFTNNRRSAGRLNELILKINELGSSVLQED